MKCVLSRWTILLLTVSIAGCSGAPTRPESVGRGDYAKVAQYVSALVRYEMKKRDVTGLSIALVDDQRVVWAEGFGYADKAGKIPASPETVYRAGSISKLFTATAAMQLAEQGRLDIDRPLGDYLPGFSIRTRFVDEAPVTPRSIMTHHSGLPSDYLKGMWTRNPESFTRLADRVRDEYAANPPGTVFSYSNLGVTLLGDAIGKVAGRDFVSHVRDEILLPERKLGVVVLANSDTSGRVVGKVAAEALKLALEAKTGDRQPEREKPEGGEGSLSQEALQRYEGWYATPVGAVSVRKTSGGLRADVMNRTLRLIPRADGSLGLQYRLLGLFPIRIEELDGVGISRADVAGREILAACMHGREFPIGERMRPVPVPAQWLGRTGEYEIANPGEDAVLPEKVRLRAEGGFLFVDYSIPLLFPGTMNFAIAPISDTEAVIRGFGRGMGETVRAVTVDGENMLSYSGYFLRKKGM
jgi:CubicO group peptidase (beta-lactamase class C family)